MLSLWNPPLYSIGTYSIGHEGIKDKGYFIGIWTRSVKTDEMPLSILYSDFNNSAYQLAAWNICINIVFFFTEDSAIVLSKLKCKIVKGRPFYLVLSAGLQRGYFGFGSKATHFEYFRGYYALIYRRRPKSAYYTSEITINRSECQIGRYVTHDNTQSYTANSLPL